jgi:hypothetical protein
MLAHLTGLGLLRILSSFAIRTCSGTSWLLRLLVASVAPIGLLSEGEMDGICGSCRVKREIVPIIGTLHFGCFRSAPIKGGRMASHTNALHPALIYVEVALTVD